MPKPKNKKELTELSKVNFEKLLNFIEQLPAEKREADFPYNTLNRNIRDVLAHLHHWHLLMLDWHKVGMSGQKPTMPSEGYTWKTVPDLNKKINSLYTNTPLNKIKKELIRSFENVQKLIQQHSDEELFEKKRYHWTGSTSLGAYLISASSSHYDWAFKLIKKSTK